MPLMVGQHINRIDRKGRVSVPKHFRDFCQDRGGPGIYAYPSPYFPTIEGCDEQYMRRLMQSINKLPLFSPEQNNLSNALLASASFLSFDPEGRITLPPHFAAHAALDGEAAFVGRGITFQIWHPEAFRAVQAKALKEIQERGTTLALQPELEAPQ